MRNIFKSFGGVNALRDVSFQCRPGTVHALVGENGAGKSTLIKILAGALLPDSGEIFFKGQKHQSFSTRKALNSGISVIYQELALVSQMTVAENIFLGREPRKYFGIVDKKRLKIEAKKLLKQLGFEVDMDMEVGEMTVAYQQMVEIAKALSKNADLIIMDEPSAILAGHELDQLFLIIESLKKRGVTIIYISHRLEEVFRIANEVTILKDGQLVGTKPIKDLSRGELVKMMVGRTLEEVFPVSFNQLGNPVLQVEEISTKTILNQVSFNLREGEILGVAGMVGSGRTELARAIFGADPLTSGTIKIKGQDVVFKNPADAIRSKISLVPEDRKYHGLFTKLSILNNITLPILSKISRWGFTDKKKENEIVERERQIHSIDMTSGNQEVQYLSGGNQQKVVLSKSLQTIPEVIIMDEPTRGVDVGAKFEIYQLIRQLNKDGIAILMISSELPEILGLSDRILVMREGKIVAELTPNETNEEMIIEFATTNTQQSVP
ncbi:MAG TPA: sugar ABC transporter ATP-binding protein [Gammaproteobacteria bacterium]|nr:sugar ABC transporter ATP-binding protein [Gammaproteobacteria bacterium]HIL77185.1 sugar ABC transporter ATP-binding protein [Rhodospirillales bacterium]